MYPYVYHNYAQVQYIIQISRVALYTHCLYSRCIGVLYQLYFSCVSLHVSKMFNKMSCSVYEYCTVLHNKCVADFSAVH